MTSGTVNGAGQEQKRREPGKRLARIAMRIAFIAGLAAGFAGVLAAAYYSPWLHPGRLPSETSVVANGGRAERFVIRLPSDRVAAGGSLAAGLRALPYPQNLVLPSAATAHPVLLEEFKLRDRAGSVVGLAARHWTETAHGPASAWLLLLPGRGALMLAGPGEGASAVDSVLANAGRKRGRAWSGEAQLDIGAGGIVSGSGEFAGFTGRYKETWQLTGIEAGGELRGTITLDTVAYQGS
ncbi:MAG TPA: hypothetical protein VFY39_16605 [Gammaproteobacteria bacterium]|nr:hypothetical protein [Gammaproteobacteria bacterium]